MRFLSLKWIGLGSAPDPPQIRPILVPHYVLAKKVRFLSAPRRYAGLGCFSGRARAPQVGNPAGVLLGLGPFLKVLQTLPNAVCRREPLQAGATLLALVFSISDHCRCYAEFRGVSGPSPQRQKHSMPPARASTSSNRVLPENSENRACPRGPPPKACPRVGT